MPLSSSIIGRRLSIGRLGRRGCITQEEAQQDPQLDLRREQHITNLLKLGYTVEFEGDRYTYRRPPARS